MRVLVDLVHPSDVLFFARPIRRLCDEGHSVLVVSREKDVTSQLLISLGIEHTQISRIGGGRIGLAAEMVLRDARLLSIALQFRPDVMVGFGGIAISHVGWLLRRRSVGFYDTEPGTLQMKLTLPFISEWHVGDSYCGPEAKGRTYRFHGIKELSYLHPDHFIPDRAKALEAGFAPDRKNFLLRLVAWGAAHDLGKRSLFGRDALLALVSWLERRGVVHLIAEGQAPDQLERLLFRGDPLLVHHLMAFSDLYVGEGATMAAEAAVLGTPAFFLSPLRFGYIRELQDHGLVQIHHTLDDLFPALTQAITHGRRLTERLRDTYVKERIDMSDHVLSVLENSPTVQRESHQRGN